MVMRYKALFASHITVRHYVAESKLFMIMTCGHIWWLVVWLRRAHFACMFICSIITNLFFFADKFSTVHRGAMVCAMTFEKNNNRRVLHWTE